jgi:hypothetical protein
MNRGLLNLQPFLLPLVFHGRFGYQLEFAQRALKFSVRFFSGDAQRVNRRVVAVFGPRDGFGHVGIPVTLGLGAVDVQFHLWTPLRQPLYM